MMRKVAWSGVFWLVWGVGCARNVSKVPKDTLEGVEFEVSTRGLQTEGSLGGSRVSVLLDSTAFLSSVSDVCYFVRPEPDAVVRVPDWKWGSRELSTFLANDLTVAGKRLGLRRMALSFDSKECEVVLGLDVLNDYALQTLPEKKRVRVVASNEVSNSSLRLERAPKSDWVLWPVKLVGASDAAGSTLLFSTLNDCVLSQKHFRIQGLTGVEWAPGKESPLSNFREEALPSGIDGVLCPAVWSQVSWRIDFKRNWAELNDIRDVRKPAKLPERAIPLPPIEGPEPEDGQL